MPHARPYILSVRDLHRDFGGVHALHDVDLDVRRGSITGLIGPNGSGKTTLFHVISGIDRGATGEITLDGEPILGLRPHEIYLRGLARIYVDLVFDQILALKREGRTLLMVEQNAARALAVSDRGYALELGRNRFTDTGANLLANEEVRRMYLGGSPDTYGCY